MIVKRWRHKKLGLTYVEIARGKLQVLDSGRLDMQPMVIYRSEEDGSVWCRPEDEFEDGRFEPLPDLDSIEKLTELPQEK